MQHSSLPSDSSHDALTRRRGFVVLSALTAAGVALAARPRAGSTAGRVRIAVGGMSSLYYLPLTLAQQLGYFAAEGLEVVLRDYDGGALALQAARAGEAELCCGAYAHVLRLQAQSQDWRAFAVLGRAPQCAVALAASPQQRRGAGQGAARSKARPAASTFAPGALDWRGVRMGVSALDSSTHMLARAALAHAGHDPERVVFVPVGHGDAALQALRTGHVQAMCQSEPLMTQIEQTGQAQVVYDLRTLKGSHEILGGAMPAACLYAPQSWLQANAALAQALAHAVVHALKWLQTAAAADLARVLPGSHLQGHRAAYLAAFAKVRETFALDGLMPQAGPATTLRVLALADPGQWAGARPDLARTYTQEFARTAKQRFGA